MESSRIFVRGLPPNLNEQDFRKHFSKQAVITDAKVIPHRRIGYIGYGSPEDAAKAVKYHNKSFIRMSKIGVELARSVDDQYALKTAINSANNGKREHAETKDFPTETSKESQKRRKLEGAQESDGEAKLQEFLKVMQPPSKSKTWENQEEANLHISTEPTFRKEHNTNSDMQKDEEYEHVPKKQKRDRNNGQKEERAIGPLQPADASLEHTERNIAEENSEEATKRTSGAVQPASDADWLRSHTSRLLGLVDDDDALGAPELPEDIRPQILESYANDRQYEIRSNYDAGIRTNEEARNKELAKPISQPISVEDTAASNGRLFVRNLAYTTTEDDLRNLFESGGYGTVEEVHLPIDSRSGNNKGFAHIQYAAPKAASRALGALDRKPFQGRLLHIMPSNVKEKTEDDEFVISKLPLKKQQQMKRKAEAASSTFNWNSMYMNSDAVMSSISDRLGVSKSDLLDPTSSDAAVKQAHAETHIIQETRAYFIANGVDLDAFKQRERGDMAILIKNFSYGTKVEELKKLFEAYGHITKMLMPPSGTIAIVEFDQADHARSAFGSLAYRKLKNSILFLEKAPSGLFGPLNIDSERCAIPASKALATHPSATEPLEGEAVQQSVNTSTLFVRNLNFSTTTSRLREVFQPLNGFMSARVKTKPDAKKPGQLLSMGFGFLEFRSEDDARTAVAAMDGYKLDGHELLIRASHKAIDAAEERRKEGHAKKLAGRKTKIIIKNLPFEASKKDVRSLFGSYGQLRSVRVPQKIDSSARGFAFADFVTAKEAENAMDALRDTHLLGRRLVLEFAAEHAIDPEQEIEQMQQKVGKQADKVALQRLTGSGRKKFNVEGADDDHD